jgi:hypothetical protein
MNVAAPRFNFMLRVLPLIGMGVACVLMAALPPSAEAGKWKRGVYEGTIDAEQGERPKTEIKLRVTKKIKLLEAEFLLRCDSGTQIEATVGPSKKAKINKGPAGGGFSISEFAQTSTYQEDYSLVGGVRRKTAKGNINASRTYDEPYDNCNDFITLTFKAKR